MSTVLPVVSAAGSYALDRQLLASLPPGQAMTRAAFGVAQEILALLRGTGQVAGSHVLLLVGAGDNGGDALFAGSYLRRRGVGVTAVLLSSRWHEAGAQALTAAGGRLLHAAAEPTIPTALLERSALCVDGIVGIGGTGPLRAAAAAWVSAVDRVGLPVLAIDVPSGVAVDTGQVTASQQPKSASHVTATTTVAIGTYKPVHVLAPQCCGTTTVLEIGHEPVTDQAEGLVGWVPVGSYPWPLPGRTDSKYTQGVTGVFAGSRQYPGAGVLALRGALAATAGMVCHLNEADLATRIAVPEVVSTTPENARVNAWVVGPGAGITDRTAAVLEHVVCSGLPVVIDADALTVLSRDPHRVTASSAPERVLLTPHDGEFARLAGSPVGPDRVAAARALAVDYQATVLLKGASTIITDGTDAGTYLVDTGSSFAATAGSGDVLAGLIGALWASRPEESPAALAAQCVRVHARAALLAATTPAGWAPTSASVLAAQLPLAIAQLRAGKL